MVHFIGAEDRNRTGTRGKSRRILSPVRLPVPPLRHTTWLRATLPGGRPPSTIAAKELNFCVRYGNRCIRFAIITTLYVCPSLKTNVFALANSFWIIVFFKKLSRNSPLNCLTNSLIVSNAYRFLIAEKPFRIKIYLTKFLHYEVFKVQVQLLLNI